MWRIVYLHPLSSISTWPGSDTIFGAVCWALRTIYGTDELMRWLDRLSSDDPPFIPSSAFPFARSNGKTIRFLPKPLSLLPRNGGEMRDAIKTLKRTNFISEGMVSRMPEINELPSLLTKGDIVISGDCMMWREERPEGEIYTRKIVQHTSVDRMALSGAEGLLFYEEQISFSSGSGLYFLARVSRGFPLEPAMRYLEHTGIGGNRSVGKGHYRIEISDIKPPEQESAGKGKVMLLSRCIPRPDEFDWEDETSGYKIITLRPKMESKFTRTGQPLYKGIIRTLAEGSVMKPTLPKPFYGRLVPTVERILHNGLSLAMREPGGA